MNFDVVIVGAGALGLALAYHLRNTGLSVLVIEREELPGTHASGKNAGMIRKLYRHEALTDWAQRSTELWPSELKKKCFRETGSLIVTRRRPGHHDELFQERLVALTRNGKKKSVSAIFTQSDGLLDSPTYMTGLHKLAKAAGAEFRFREEVFRIEHHDSRWHVETIQGSTFAGTWLVNASGAWLTHVIDENFRRSLPEVRPYARHLFVVSGFPANFMPEPGVGFYWDEDQGWYLRQWDRSSRLVSICDRSPATPETFVPDPQLHESVSQVLIDALPKISKRLHISRAWHCFRTYTEDQLPLVGEDPTHRRFFWLGAFGGFGMSTSFAAAKDVCAYISEKDGGLPLEFSPVLTRLNKAIQAL